MNIALCIKQVPNISKIQFDYQSKTILREGVPLEVNVFDLIALGKALELKKETEAHITAITMGPPQARDALAHCLAAGADHAVLISDRAMAGSDTLATSRTLALALKDRGFDLILCGRNSTDSETGQVGPQLAELLGIPHVSRVRKLDYQPQSNSIQVERVTDEGYEVVRCPLPALVTTTEGLAPEPSPRRQAIAEAMERPVEEVSAAQLSHDSSSFGAAGSPTSVENIRLVEPQRLGRLIEDADPVAAALQVVQGLKELCLESTEPVLRPADRFPGQRNQALWVVGEREAEGLRHVTFEILGKARDLAQELRSEVAAVFIGDVSPQEVCALAVYGADRVLVFDNPNGLHPAGPAVAAALATAVQDRRPYALLFPSTANGRDLASRLAARLSLGLTGDCIDLELDSERRLVQMKPALGGNVVAPILSSTKPYLTTLRPGLLASMDPQEGATAPVERLDFLVGTEDSLQLLESHREEDARGLELEAASIVLGVGRGLGGPEHLPRIFQLAEKLGASVAATRMVTDAGWLPKQIQVGLTGRAIAPDIYIAVGVRGAFNHTVGLQRAGTIIAINTNPKHPMAQAADFTIVGDWQDYLEPLANALSAAGYGPT